MIATKRQRSSASQWDKKAKQVHTEVNESPLNLLSSVLLLLESEHVVVEELLQLLVGVVCIFFLKKNMRV